MVEEIKVGKWRKVTEPHLATWVEREIDVKLPTLFKFPPLKIVEFYQTEVFDEKMVRRR